jgi:hypothetical protein
MRAVAAARSPQRIQASADILLALHHAGGAYQWKGLIDTLTKRLSWVDRLLKFDFFARFEPDISLQL